MAKEIENMKSFISRKTAKLRYALIHGLMRTVTPSLHKSIIGFPRPMILFLKDRFKNKPLIGVEIGVAFGNNALSICKTLNMKKLFLIDPYVVYMNKHRLWSYYLNAYEEAERKTARFNVEFIRKKSEKAIEDINCMLDFVYIDGDHSFRFIKKDLELYYPKVKIGGVIGGHDFDGGFIDVPRAVLEFSKKRKLALNGLKSDYWIVKN